MDGYTFRQIAVEHWKLLAGGGVLLVLIVVAVTVSLVLALPSSSSSASPNNTPEFMGPDDINGDAGGLNAQTFKVLQIIENPDQKTSGFGATLFAHDAGFLAVLQNEATPTFQMYRTNLSGVIEVDSTLAMPTGWVVVDAAFAPMFNVQNEVYYFFVSLGVPCADAACNELDPARSPAVVTHLGVHVALYAYDTDPGSAQARQWVRTDFRGDDELLTALGTHNALSLPVPPGTFAWDANTPWVGTFGDRLQAVLDDNNTTPIHSLYVRGSEYDPEEPGGSVYWYSLQDNTPTPTVLLNLVVKDARLLQLRAAEVAGRVAARPTKTATDYINGFGSSFYVTSGRERKNLLVVANPSNDDYAQIRFADGNTAGPAMPNGYVQIYELSATPPLQGWTQTRIAGGTPGDYYLRYDGRRAATQAAPTRGWCYEVGVVENFLLVGRNGPVANPTSSCPGVTPPNGSYAEFEAWTLGNTSTTCSSATPCDDRQQYRGSLVLDFGFSPALYHGDPLQSVGARFRQTIAALDGRLLVSVFSDTFGNTVNLSDYNGTSGTAGTSAATDPFQCFDKVQDLGTNENSSLDTDPLVSGYGFAQGLGYWYSRTRGTLYLAVSDPAGPRPSSLSPTPGPGRVIVLAKQPRT